MKRLALGAAVVLTLGPAFALRAQSPAPATLPAPGDPAAPMLAEEANAEGRLALDVELEPTGGYTYNPQGRRDPFVSLQKPVAPESGAKTRPTGFQGFLVQEVALKGIVRSQGGGMGVANKPGYIAMFLGTDGKSYFVTTGQRLFDGIITNVDATTVYFRQEVTDPLSPVKSRELKKSLYQTEEARP
jgi:hypothetical protein